MAFSLLKNNTNEAISATAAFSFLVPEICWPHLAGAADCPGATHIEIPEGLGSPGFVLGTGGDLVPTVEPRQRRRVYPYSEIDGPKARRGQWKAS